MVAAKSPLKTCVIVVVIAAAVGWTIFPLYYLFLTSVKSASEIMASPPRFLVWPSFETYERILIKEQFYQFFVNSFVISAGSSLERTLITPRPPSAISGIVMASSPQSTSKLSGS